MGLADIVSSGIATVKSVTADLQADITLEAWISNDNFGGPNYASSVTLPAIVEMKEQRVRTVNDEDVLSRAVITILQPVTANGATGRKEPIDPRDRITLPDSTIGPILKVEGMINPDTSELFMVSVWLGDIK